MFWWNDPFFFLIVYTNVISISTKLGSKYPWVKVIKVCSNEGPNPFPRGDNYEKVKIHWRNFKIFFSRTTEPISIKLGTKHSWVKGIKVCSNEGPRPSPSGDNSKHVKLYWRYLKIFSSTTAQLSMKLGTKHPLVEGIHFCSS